MEKGTFQQQFSDQGAIKTFHPLWGNNKTEVTSDFYPLNFVKKINFQDEEKFYLVFLKKECVKISAQTASEALERVKEKDIQSVIYAPVALRKIYGPEIIKKLK